MSKSFELVDFQAAPKVNEWVEPVAQLINATETNPDAAFKLTLDVKDEGKEVAAIRAAAKDVGKTVRIRHRDAAAVTKVGTKDNGKDIFEGKVILTVSVTDKYADGRGRPKKGEEKTAKDSK